MKRAEDTLHTTLCFKWSRISVMCFSAGLVTIVAKCLLTMRKFAGSNPGFGMDVGLLLFSVNKYYISI